MTNSRTTVTNRRAKALRIAAIALVALGIMWLGSLFVYVSLTDRNSYYTCADYEPSSMAFSPQLTQITSRVTVLPLVLECSFTNESNPPSTQYVVVEKDLGTAWWLGVPASFLAAAAVWIASRRKTTDPNDGPAK